MKRITDLVCRDQFGIWLNDAGLVGSGVEVGVFEGEYAAQLIRTWTGQSLTGIDPFIMQSPDVYRDGCNRADLPVMALSVAARFRGVDRYHLMIAPSLTAAPSFGENSLDFVYIDANHAKDWCLADIHVWWPKLKIGGVMGGHDFYDRHDDLQECGVASAVLDFMQEIAQRPHITFCSSWWFQKR